MVGSVSVRRRVIAAHAQLSITTISVEETEHESMTAHTPANTENVGLIGQNRYKTWVKKILDLPFEDLGSTELVRMCYLSWVTAIEFAEALRVAERLYGDHAGLRNMIAGELQTTNLAFDDYHRAGDHHEFLAHFLARHGHTDELAAELGSAGTEYLDRCRELDDLTRAMSVFSREEELPRIFTRFLRSPERNWKLPLLRAYRYYLERHIALDSDEGGHADMICDLPFDDRIEPFYHARFRLYRRVPTFARSGAYDTEA